MKHLFTTLILVIAAITAFAQSPEMFNYQGVARDNAGNVLANQPIGLRLSIQDGIATDLYVETHSVTTNAFGLFNVSIGGGTLMSGSFAGIAWGGDSHYVKVEMDPAGGIAYANLGVSQLLSVPYALYAESSGTGGPAGPTGSTGADGTQWTTGTGSAPWPAEEGDLYYNTSTGDVSQVITEAWTVIGNIMGSTGPTGATGPLVAGSTNETLRHNGASWIADNNLTNSGSLVEIESQLNVGESRGQLYNDNLNFNVKSTANLKLRTGGTVYNVSVFKGTGSVPFANFDGSTESVGIGTSLTDPVEKLEVNGNIAVSGTARTIFAPDGAFNLSSASGMDLIIDNDDNSTNSSLRIKNNGDGSDILMEVKENGDVKIDGEYAYQNVKTHYLTISQTEFRSILPQTYLFGQPDAVNYYGKFVTGGTAFGYATAPLHLPDGARITEVRAWLWDNDATAPVRIKLLRLPFGSSTTSVAATVQSDAATAMESVQELSSSLNQVINNLTTSYLLRFQGIQNSDDTRLYGVRVSYTVEQAD